MTDYRITTRIGLDQLEWYAREELDLLNTEEVAIGQGFAVWTTRFPAVRPERLARNALPDLPLLVFGGRDPSVHREAHDHDALIRSAESVLPVVEAEIRDLRLLPEHRRSRRGGRMERT